MKIYQKNTFLSHFFEKVIVVYVIKCYYKNEHVGVIMKYILSLLIACVYAVLAPMVVEAVVEYKQRQRTKALEDRAYSIVFYRLICFIVGCGVTYLAQTHYELLPMSIVILIGFMACVGTLVDNRIRIIPNEMVIVLFVLGLILRFISGGLNQIFVGLICVVGTILIFALSYVVSKMFSKGMIPVGAGDLKLLMAMAMIVSYPGIMYAVFGIAVSMLLYIFIGAILKKITFYSYLPMAGFIYLGILIGIFSKFIESMIF